MNRVEAVIRMFEERGRDAYHGEAVSQAEHALQAAHLAESAGAPVPLVLAALLHDVGHLLHDLGEDAADRGIDDHHERSGSHWLARSFGPEVADPVRLHVDAKRYLCAVEGAYLDALSPASKRSLALQGGPMTPEEVARFEANPRHADAVRLRRWDDEAKVPGLEVPGLDHYLDRLAASFTEPAGA
jgi:phosphonate degradation associated HDIG domain protein